MWDNDYVQLLGHNAAFLNVLKRVDCGENVRTLYGIARVWPQPGKVPFQDVHRRVLVSVHDQPADGTVIHSFPEGHLLPVATARALLGGISFIVETIEHLM